MALSAADKIVRGDDLTIIATLLKTYFEASNNKVTSLSSSSTDIQYPSAKCVYDLIGDIETLINAL